MPGIFGIINKTDNKYIDQSTIDQMIQECMHEDFYNSYIYKNHEKGIFLASITILGSFSDCLPICNEEKNVFLFFTGEVYTAGGRIKSVLNCHKKNVESNAASLLSMYIDNQDLFFKELNGWYSGAILDLRENKLIIFNDNYSICRLYYTESPKYIIFSSEAKAILRVIPETREFDFRSLGEYITCDCTLENRTLFKNIFLLPPHSKWSFFLDGKTVKENTLDINELENVDPIAEDQFVDTICSSFEEIVPNYLSCESIGFSLTGGLDTRTLLSLISGRYQFGELPCYTFTSMYNKSLDTRIAQKISSLINQPFYPIILNEEFLNNFSYHAEKTIFVTDGVTDVGRSDEIYLNNKARAIAPIRLTGKFGSQVMRNLSVLKARLANKGIFCGEFQRYIFESEKTLMQHLSPSNGCNLLSFMLFKEIPWYWAGFTVAESSQLSVRSPYLDNGLIKLLYRSPRILSGNLDKIVQAKLLNNHNKKLWSLMTDKGLLLSRSNIISEIQKLIYLSLNYSDKIYNANYLPMNMHNFFHFIDTKLHFLKFHKVIGGRNTFRHYRHWFQDHLSNYVKELLLDHKTLSRPYVDRKALKNCVFEHIQGRKNNISMLTKMMSIELINQTLIEKYRE